MIIIIPKVKICIMGLRNDVYFKNMIFLHFWNWWHTS